VIWDQYLSSQDRIDIAQRPAARVGFGSKPCLLLIDLYRAAFGDRPLPLAESVAEYPSSCGMAGWQALPSIEKLLAAGRAAGVPVVHTKNIRSNVLSPWFHKPQGEARLPEEGARLGLDDLMDEVRPDTGELLLQKASPSAFWGTPLAGHLIGLGVDTVIVAGESTSGCVRASVVDGCTSRFRMIVVEECVFDRHEASHAISLFDMDRKYADVCSLTDAVAYLGECAGREPR
jgi:maleamate amidohydrolase